MHDVFISFNSTDRERARDLAEWLRAKGLSVFVDEAYLTPGLNWVEGLERAVDGCKSVVVLLGPSGLGKWQKAELHLALDRHQSQPSFPLVPVLLPGNDDPPTGFLALNTWIDLRSDPRDSRGLANLHAALLGKPPAEADFDPRAEVCPYRGLLPFREEDRDFFTGREDDVAELLKRVRDARHPVVGVVGRSGSGKSSLVYAGLIPELRDPKSGAPWEIFTLRPRNEPLHELMEALSSPPTDADLVERRAQLNKRVDLLREGDVHISQLVTDLLKQNTGSERLLLFVDQWEELYSQAGRSDDPEKQKQIEADRELFIDSILEAATNTACTLVFTVRADFYDQILTHKQLTAHVDQHGLSLGPMTQEELRRCIEKPAEIAGYRFEDGLVDRIMGDVRNEPGRLPLLEYLLLELWKNRDRDEFTHAGYETAGGVSGALAKRAEQEYLKLEAQGDTALLEATRRVFVSLVTPGEGREDTRTYLKLPKDALERTVVEHFSAAGVRLITATDQSIELSHEALIRQWPRLREEWLDRNREILRVKHRIRAAMTTWEAEGRPKSRLLPPGKALEEGRDLLTNHGDVLIDDIEPYISASSQREKQRRKVLYATVIAAFAAMTGLTVVAIMQRSAALKAKHETQLQLFAGYMQQAATARDHLDEPILSGHYYLQAAKVAQEEREPEELGLALLAQKNLHLPCQSFVHNDQVRGAKVLAGGTQILTWSDDGTVRIWHVTGGNPTATFKYPDEVYGAEVLADGTQILTWGGMTARIWPITGGELTATFKHDDKVRGAKELAGGTQILTWSDDGTAAIWPITGGEPTVVFKHDDRVNGLEALAGGTQILTWSDDDTARIWPITGGEPTVVFKHDDRVLGAKVLAGATQILTWSDDGTAKIWPITGGEATVSFKHDGGVYGGEVLAGGTQILTWGSDWTARIWPITGGAPIATFKHDSWVSGAEALADGTQILTWSDDGTARIWPINGDGPPIVFEHHDRIYEADVLPDGRQILIWGRDGTARIWPIFGGAPTAAFKHVGGVRGAEVLASGTQILTWGGMTARIWPITGGELTATFKHDDKVRGAKELAGATQILTWSDDGTARLWSITGGEPTATFKHDDAYLVYRAEVLADGTQTLTLGGMTARIWPITGGEPTATFKHGDDYEIYGAEVLADGTQILTWSKDGTARIWPITGGEATTIFKHDRAVNGAQVLAGGTHLLTWSDDETARIWPITGGEPTVVFKHDDRVHEAYVLPDGTQLLTWSYDGTVRIWPVTGGESTAIFKHRGPVHGARVLAGGTQILTWSCDGTAKIWPITGGEPTATFKHGDDYEIYGAEVLADGTQILTWSKDGTARIWPITGGDPTTIFKHEGGVHGAEMLAGGAQILTWGRDGTAKIWPITGGEAAAIFKHYDYVDGAEVLADGTQILTWAGKTVKAWDISVDLRTSVEEQIRQYEIRTGTTLNASGRMRVLSYAEWEGRMKAAP